MPTAAKHPCSYPGCPELVARGFRYCLAHTKQVKRAVDRGRPSARDRGYDARWEKARKAFLSANPLCVRCKAKGLIKPSRIVDHIIPHKGDQRLFWDETNWQALCKTCHDEKTATEDGGFGNSPSAKGCGADGMPTSPNHPWNSE